MAYKRNIYFTLLVTENNASEAALAANNSFAATVGLRDQLEKSWLSKSLVIKHADQPSAEIPPEKQKRLFQPSPCFGHGTCVCANSGPLGADPLHFNTKLVGWLKQTCWSKPKEKRKAEERLLLENARVVLKLEKCDSDGNSERNDWELEEMSGEEVMQISSVLFFHIGFANYKIWTLCFQQLYFRRDCRHRPKNSLAIDLQTASVASQSTLQEQYLGEDRFQTSVEAFKESLDLSYPYKASFYTINDSQEQLDEVESKSGYVQIVPRAVAPKLVWLGSEAERLSRRESRDMQPKSKRAKTMAKPSAQPAKGARKRSRAIEDQPMPAIEGEQDLLASEASGDDDSMASQSIHGGNEFDGDNSDSQSDQVSEVEPPDELNVLDEFLDELFADELSSANASGASDAEAAPDTVQNSGSKKSSSSSSDSGSDSDSDSSDDSSSSSNTGDPAGPLKPSMGRALPVSELVMEFPPYGSLRYNASGYMRAQCTDPRHGKTCQRRRVCYANALRPGQGRPAGLLAAWLLSGSNYESSKDHIRAGIESFDARQAGRRQLMELRGASEFLSHEDGGFKDLEPPFLP